MCEVLSRFDDSTRHVSHLPAGRTRPRCEA
jgi:hypothetical protein